MLVFVIANYIYYLNLHRQEEKQVKKFMIILLKAMASHYF